MEFYTFLRNVTDLLSDGKTPYERRFGQSFKGPIIPFGSLVEYHPKTAKDQSIWRESLSWTVLWICFVRGENLEGWHGCRHVGCRPCGVGGDGRIGNLLIKTQRERGFISFENVKINWVFQSCKSRQVMSQFGVIYVRRTMSTQHWSRLVMLQVNTSSEQSVQYSLSSVQRSRTPVQYSRKGLALWWLIILPGWVITPVGPGKDTHGTPVPNSGKAVGGPIKRSASQQQLIGT